MSQNLKGLSLLTIISFSLIACVPPGQIKKQATPGHIMQTTGYNPASGKLKVAKGKMKAKNLNASDNN